MGLASNASTNQEIESFVSDIYGFECKATYIYGEHDLNYKLVKTSKSFILKITRYTAINDYLVFQKDIVDHIAERNTTTPPIIPTKNKSAFGIYKDTSGQEHIAYMMAWTDGVLWAHVNPITTDLRSQLGNKAGQLTQILHSFQSDYSPQDIRWDISQSHWTKNQRTNFDEDQWSYLQYFIGLFETIQTEYQTLRKGFVHNDVNDHNILVDSETRTKVVSIIDFGDAFNTQIINDVAITCCYAAFNTENPLQAVKEVVYGYHQSYALQEKELQFLYVCIGMRLVISLCHSTLNKIKNPENTYLQVSEQGAWNLIKKWKDINASFALYTFRNACNFIPHPQDEAFKHWSKNKKFDLKELFPNADSDAIQLLDLSVGSSWLGHSSDFNNLDLFQFKLNEFRKEHKNAIPAGGYLEPRPIYTSDTYGRMGNSGKESRSIHLGIDFWLPSETPVHALIDGTVVIAVNDEGYKEYGGLIVLEHTVDNLKFYTLYGHLSVQSAVDKNIGDVIKKGEKIGALGHPNENGVWASHLHFQIMLNLLDYTIDFPGVAYHSEIDIWKSICPNPNLLFKLQGLDHDQKIATEDLIVQRKSFLGPNLSLSYAEPLHIVRGEGVYLLDQFGRKYLDTVNNVAHVGHEHYQVLKAGREQMALLNTNTRYLHQNILRLAEKLSKTLPSSLEVVYFVNSGSEANELALRMVESYTGSRHMLVSEVGYHGNTARCIEVSSYKFDGKGGNGKPDHTHVFPIPDAFRGKYRGHDCSKGYLKEVAAIIEKLAMNNKTLGGLILEPIISCGGQIELPRSFLSQVYQLVHKAGGICISDEVQVGCGRVGSHFWGFEMHDVIPDIVTIGKPLGNGHPIGAVVCTREVAESFSNGMEYFNTFGGNPVSCAIASQVLKTIIDDALQANAHRIGQLFKSELIELSKRFPIIGHVRGQGLFLGFELVDADLQPLPHHAKYLMNRMRDYGVLMSTDGKDANVIKIKPPMTFNKNHVQEVMYFLTKVFEEDAMHH